MGIIVQLLGGLGNQMFQYAAGRALAHRLDLPLKLDISSYENDALRSYKLHHLSIKETFANSNEIVSYEAPRLGIKKLLYRVRSHILPWYLKEVIHEKKRGFDEDFFKIKQSCLLNGYWQSEKYFSEIEEIIRSEFKVKRKPEAENAKMLSKIKEHTSVSIHIRRGDYVTNPVTNKVHGFLGLEYYNRAISHFEKRLTDPVFLVFSDDIEWARENIQSNDSLIFVDHNNEDNDYEDLRLMRNCKFHIIANSSFSWWGAWLSEYHNKEVVAPKKWFASSRKQRENVHEIVPKRWMRL
jgi:hypothetical protein